MTPNDLLIAAMLEVARRGDFETLDKLAELADDPDELARLVAEVTQDQPAAAAELRPG